MQAHSRLARFLLGPVLWIFGFDIPKFSWIVVHMAEFWRKKNPIKSALLIAILMGLMARHSALGARPEDSGQAQQDSIQSGMSVSKLDLPNPLVMNDGQPVKTVAQWKLRREEMRKILLDNLIGELPPAPGNVEGRDKFNTPRWWKDIISADRLEVRIRPEAHSEDRPLHPRG
jgi:hypothetical protein